MTVIGIVSYALLAALFASAAWLNYQERVRLQKISADLEKELKQAEAKHLEFRAAYRDLLGDYERLHARYKELQHDHDGGHQ